MFTHAQSVHDSLFYRSPRSDDEVNGNILYRYRIQISAESSDGSRATGRKDKHGNETANISK